MTKRTANLAAYYVARRLTRMVAPALLPAERESYFREAYRVICSLIKSCKGLEERVALRLLAPSVN
jgi:hypothetical protein